MPRCLRSASYAVIAGLVAVPIAPVFAQSGNCPVEKAVYRPISKEPHEAGTDYQARFRRQAHHVPNESPFVMTIREASKRRSFEFSFYQPNGYAQTIVMQRQDRKDDAQDGKQGGVDEMPSSTALFFNSALATISPLFDRQSSAPAYMLFPDLGKAFWYGHIANREFLPPAGMWKILSCSQ